MTQKKLIIPILSGLLILILLSVYYTSFVNVVLYDKNWLTIKEMDLDLYCRSGGKINKQGATLLDRNSNFVSNDGKYYYCSASEKYTLDSFCQDGNFQIINYFSIIDEGKVFAGNNGQTCYEKARK